MLLEHNTTVSAFIEYHFQTAMQRKLGLSVMPLALHRYEATQTDSLRPEGNIFHSKLRLFNNPGGGGGILYQKQVLCLVRVGQKGLKKIQTHPELYFAVLLFC